MATLEDRFLNWLDSLGLQPDAVTALPGDVSPRRYFRIVSAKDGPTILAVYPKPGGHDRPGYPGCRAIERFLATSELFEAASVRVPRILASDARQGLMLLEDLGTVSVFDLIEGPWADLQPHIESAIQILDRLRACPDAGFEKSNPVLDANRLSGELQDAQEVFLGDPEFSGEDSERDALNSALSELLAALATEPLVPSHRDFMSRNLILPKDGTGLAVIDHQDACLAPHGYDLASLLNDSLFPPRAQEEGLTSHLSSEQALCYRRCAVQRALKATATFLKFAARGFDRHLPLVAPTLHRAAYQLELLPEGGRIPASVFTRWRDAAGVSNAIARLLQPKQRHPRLEERAPGVG